MKLTNLSSTLLGFLQATGLVVYIGLVCSLFVHGETWFGTMGNFLAPLFFLLVFVFSAVITALLVLGRSGFLFWEKRYKESFRLLGWTLGWTSFYLIALVITLISCR